MPGREIPPRQSQSWVSRSLFVLSVLAVSAFTAFRFLPFPDELAHQRSAHLHSPPRAAAGLIVLRQKGFANDPLPLGITLSNSSGGETVSLLGLMDGFELSLGNSRGTSGWLLSASDLDQAFIGPTKNFVGSIEVTVQLHSALGRLLDRRAIEYEWVPKEDERKHEHKPEQQGITQPARVELPPPIEVHPRDPAEIAMLLDRGEALLQNGDIASARLLLKRAAALGSAQAAFELGMTFDAEFLKRQGVVGADSDETQARTWYERASNLGSAEASLQLKRLAGETGSDGSH
jgi:hypothetical protein